MKTHSVIRDTKPQGLDSVEISLRLIMILAVIMIITVSSIAQTGSLKIILKDSATNEPLSFGNILVEANGVQIAKSSVDINGEVVIKPLFPGKYDIKTFYVGYSTRIIKDVKVSADKITEIALKMFFSADLKEVVVIEYSVPIINSSISYCTMYNKEQINHCATQNINSLACKSAGAFSVRCSRKRSKQIAAMRPKMRGGIVAPVGDESYNKIIDNSFKSAEHDPLSTFSIDADGASYSNMRRFIMGGHLPPPDAVRIEELLNYFTYNYPQPKDDSPFSINTEIAECPWNKEHKLVEIGLQGKSITFSKSPPNNLVFLIDVSGSMQSEDKLPLLKRSFNLLIQQLRPEDRVAIVVYAGNAGLVLESTHGDKKQKIMDAIDNLEAGGSTAGEEGILLAYKVAQENFIKDGNNRVILATDGDFNVGVSDDIELIKLIEEKRKEGSFLTSLGFGEGNYKDSKLEQLADKGNGNYYYIDNILEGKKVFVNQLGATINTIAKDVKLQIEFNPTLVKEYRLIGYENRVLNKEDFNDDTKDAGEIGSGHCVTALYEIVPAGSKENNLSVDPLKYQTTALAKDTSSNTELMTIKFRYKQPSGHRSKLIIHPLIDDQKKISDVSENFRFAASVAEFGMILRDSKYKAESDLKHVLTLAKGAKGTDEEGYRAEFIKLVEMAELMKKTTAKEE